MTGRNFRNKAILKAHPTVFVLFVVASLLFIPSTHAAGGHAESGASSALTFLWIAVILIAAKLSSLVEKFGQPAVLGELLIGVVMGNLALLGLPFFEPIKQNSVIHFLSELGLVILLFQIGLETHIEKMRRSGPRAFLVACVGVIVPFVLGTYLVGPLLLPGLTSNAYLLLGAALTATSVGITARVFQDLNKLQSPEAQIILGAAVIDDVLGLIILAVVSAIATIGSLSIGMISWISAKALLFLVFSIIAGQLMAPRLGELFARIQTGIGMKFTLAISFGLLFSYAAHLIGLAPIVGAFAAGLVLDPVHFAYFKDPHIVKDLKKASAGFDVDTTDKIDRIIKKHADRHIEDLIEPLGIFLVPIFFVLTGMSVDLKTLSDPAVLLIALGITLLAFVAKATAGLAAGKVNKLVVGFGMVPRGEVGLIFAMTGKSLNIIDDKVFSIIIAMVLFTTLLTPPILSFLLRRDVQQ